MLAVMGILGQLPMNTKFDNFLTKVPQLSEKADYGPNQDTKEVGDLTKNMIDTSLPFMQGGKEMLEFRLCYQNHTKTLENIFPFRPNVLKFFRFFALENKYAFSKGLSKHAILLLIYLRYLDSNQIIMYTDCHRIKDSFE